MAAKNKTLLPWFSGRRTKNSSSFLLLFCFVVGDVCGDNKLYLDFLDTVFLWKNGHVLGFASSLGFVYM